AAVASLKKIVPDTRQQLIENNLVAYSMDFKIDLTKYPSNDTVLIARWNNTAGDTLLLRYIVSQEMIEIDRTQAGVRDFHPEFGKIIRGKRIKKSNELKIHIIMDQSSLELFADEGSLVMSVLLFPRQHLQFFSTLL
ncbi:MAG: GH32 C-terminal domain-containing protein, partial [Chitinophagaceae bacterium]|nr:GH32 C-terminal domain-containing protein [Chitinophagaceae bacterium]